MGLGESAVYMVSEPFDASLNLRSLREGERVLDAAELLPLLSQEFEKLSSSLRGLKDLPLKIVSLQAAHAGR